MKTDLTRLIIELRLLVGFLGEKMQNNWWASNFISPSSEAFLSPVYSRTTLLAQYHGVCEAALLVHDDHIGIGTNYHLYRLPDSIEHSASKVLEDGSISDQLKINLSSTESALSRLSDFCSTADKKEEGPLVVGNFSDDELESLLKDSAGHYKKAFTEDYKCFPYMRETEC
ncbi:MAG: BrxE family protein [Candidatus Thiodiazotropha endolucinida]